MTPVFFIAHTTSGRTRIRWAGDAEYKADVCQLASAIAGIEGVDDASARLATGSIVIEHCDAPWPDLALQLNQELSIQFTSVPAAMRRNGIETFNKGLVDIDAALKKVNLDLDSLTLLTFSILAIMQALRGNVVSSSSSFLWWAYTLVAMSRNKADSSQNDHPDPSE